MSTPISPAPHVDFKYHIEIFERYFLETAPGWAGLNAERKNAARQAAGEALDFLLRHTKDPFSAPFHDLVQHMDQFIYDIPDDAQMIRYSTYEGMDGGSIEDVLKQLGYQVYFVQLQSLGDQYWVVVDRVRYPLAERISVIDGHSQQQRLLADARGFVEKAKAARQFGEQMIPYVENGLIKIMKP